MLLKLEVMKFYYDTKQLNSHFARV